MSVSKESMSSSLNGLGDRAIRRRVVLSVHPCIVVRYHVCRPEPAEVSVGHERAFAPASTAALALPSHHCHAVGMTQPTSGIVTEREGTLHWLGGISARLMIAGDATGGRFSVIEHRLGPRELGAPMHLHSREDEYSIVTDGVVGFVLGEDVVTAEPGSLVRKPRDQWHTFYNAGDTEARLLELISPAGFEQYFEELAVFFPADAPPDLDGMAEATARYGLSMRFDSLPDLVQRFDLAAPAELDAP